MQCNIVHLSLSFEGHRHSHRVEDENLDDLIAKDPDALKRYFPSGSEDPEEDFDADFKPDKYTRSESVVVKTYPDGVSMCTCNSHFKISYKGPTKSILVIRCSSYRKLLTKCVLLVYGVPNKRKQLLNITTK